MHSLSGILQDGLLDGVGTARIRAKVRGLLGILIACMLGGFYRKRTGRTRKLSFHREVSDAFLNP